MNKPRIAISSNAASESQQAKRERYLRDLDDLKRIDAIVVQQHVIRRFKSRHRSDYDHLIGMRRELDEFLATKGLEISPNQGLEVSRPRMLSCIMNFCESESNVELLQNGSLALIHEHIRAHVSAFADRILRNPLLGDLDLPHLSDILIRYSAGLAEMHRRLNYFSYYNPYGLTSEVSGEKLYTHYIRAKTGCTSHSGSETDCASEDMHHEMALWLYTDEAAQDMDLSALVETRCYLPSNQTDVKIFAGWQNEILIDKVEADNHLVLVVPITEFPVRIDSVMEEFREALLYNLIRRSRYDGDNADKADSFYESAFANTLAHHPCLVRSFAGIQMIFLGLWAWDLVELGEERAANASEAVLNRMRKLTTELGERSGISIPGDSDSIRKNGYDKVVTIAGSATGSRKRKKQRSSRIDKYLTGSRNIVLGEVD